ncbi:hypothetical protein JW905_14350 [bacterium]|nr:hypothetical protein [candidate division CSSED10-310 bacterium]
MKHQGGTIRLLLFVLIVACARGTRPAPGDPPRQLLEEAFQRASEVVEARVDKVIEFQRFPADRGNAGYVHYRASGTVTRCFKGVLERDRPLEFHFTLEYDPDGSVFTRPGTRLIFLKTDNEERFWLQDEAAQFISAPSLTKVLLELSKK